MTQKFNQVEQLVWLVKNCNTRKAGANLTSTWHKREVCSLIQGYSESIEDLHWFHWIYSSILRPIKKVAELVST